MKATSALSITCKFIALIIALDAVTSLVFMLSLVVQTKALRLVVSTGLPVMISLAVAWFLFRYSESISLRFGSSDEEIDLRLHGGPLVLRDLYRFAVRVLGAVCVVGSLPTVLGLGVLKTVSYFSYSYEFGFDYAVEPRFLPMFLSATIRLGIGIYLLASGRFLVDLAYRVKGKRPTSDSSGPTAPA